MTIGHSGSSTSQKRKAAKCQTALSSSEQVHVVSVSLQRILLQPRKASITKGPYLKERTHWCLTDGSVDLHKVQLIEYYSALFSLFPQSIALLCLPIRQLPGLLFPLNLDPRVNVLNDASCNTLKTFIFLTSYPTPCASSKYKIVSV